MRSFYFFVVRCSPRCTCRHVLNVAKESSTPFVGDTSLGLTYLHIPLLDDESQDILSSFRPCIQFIGTQPAPGRPDQTSLRFRTDDALGRNGRVLVHCVEGKSRSAAVCAAFLIKRLGLTAQQALVQLRQARPIVSPNAYFVKQLHAFQ